MSYIPEHIKCDFCGKVLERKKSKYHIFPRYESFPVRIKNYILNNPHDDAWTWELDMCPECFVEMKSYVVAKVQEKKQ